MYYSWLHQVSEYCEIQCTADQTASAYAISALYRADEKPQQAHTTFRRYLKKVEWNPDPQVEMLLNLANRLGIGEVRAVALINKFGTVYNVLKASPKELVTVEGVGLKLAERLLRTVGRGDV
jgi:ERCC4-type nuclease